MYMKKFPLDDKLVVVKGDVCCFVIIVSLSSLIL